MILSLFRQRPKTHSLESWGGDRDLRLGIATHTPLSRMLLLKFLLPTRRSRSHDYTTLRFHVSLFSHVLSLRFAALKITVRSQPGDFVSMAESPPQGQFCEPRPRRSMFPSIGWCWVLVPSQGKGKVPCLLALSSPKAPGLPDYPLPGDKGLTAHMVKVS